MMPMPRTTKEHNLALALRAAFDFERDHRRAATNRENQIRPRRHKRFGHFRLQMREARTQPRFALIVSGLEGKRFFLHRIFKRTCQEARLRIVAKFAADELPNDYLKTPCRYRRRKNAQPKMSGKRRTRFGTSIVWPE